MKRFCKDLKMHSAKMINYEKKEMIPFTDEENKSYLNQEDCYICKKGFITDDDNKKYHKVRDHRNNAVKYRGAADNIYNLRYKTPKKIPVKFHDVYTHSYRFISWQKNMRVTLNAQDKIQKNVFVFQYEVKKNLVITKQLHTS